MKTAVLCSLAAALLAIVASAQTPVTQPAHEPRSIGVAYSDGVQHVVTVTPDLLDAVRQIEAEYRRVNAANETLPDGRKNK